MGNILLKVSLGNKRKTQTHTRCITGCSRHNPMYLG